MLIKSLHILSVIIFIGNILVSGIWKYKADITRDLKLIRFAQDLITITDWIFTLPASILLAVTGYLLMGGDANPTWLILGQLFFIASGIIWILILVPIQIKQSRIIRNCSNELPIPQIYWKLAKAWTIFGIVATLLPLLTIFLMVLKPF